MPPIFPFTAIVGQERMKRALILNAVNPRIGGVLIRGERGTAKSTAARALAALLPEVKVVESCRFGCDPDRPSTWCTECHERASNNGDKLPFTVRRTSFVNLPVSATEDRVVGTLDIEKAIQKGERRFDAGVLAAANRGLLYVDEVNLLDDHVVDILLDSAAMGINVVEREGISFTHPSRFILVGTMNPEEGDLRPQLLDRFALAVDIHGLINAPDRVAIMERNLDYENDPEAFRKVWEARESEMTKEIEEARNIVENVKYDQKDLQIIAALTTSLGVDGHRADLVILRAARANAAFGGRLHITEQDIIEAAELALPHRVKHGPLQKTEVNVYELEERVSQIKQDMGATDGTPKPSDETAPVKKNRA
ncbi:MAG: ATP-binding protein [Chloroflexi bacterium]|nr:ATP-binding protein [Chloroflexota bacterium]